MEGFLVVVFFFLILTTEKEKFPTCEVKWSTQNANTNNEGLFSLIETQILLRVSNNSHYNLFPEDLWDITLCDGVPAKSIQTATGRGGVQSWLRKRWYKPAYLNY